MGEAHARLGPSNHRWPHCPGSVREEAQYPDIPGDAAIDGTGSHLLLEMCLLNNVRAEVYDREVIGEGHPDSPHGWMVAPDRIERVQMCLDYVERRIGELTQQFPNARILTQAESKANPGGMFGRDDWWGTCDITITVFTPDVDYPRFIEVIDYKDGRQFVPVKGNTQLLSYLGGQARPFIASGPDMVRPLRPKRLGAGRITIVQPKTTPPVRYEDISGEELVDELQKLADAAYRTDDPDAPLIPGKHCQWCSHGRAGNCTAKSEKGLETVKTMSNDIIATEGQSFFELIEKSMGDISQLDDAQLAELADAREPLNAIFDKVNDEIELRIQAGSVVPGYAIRPGRGSNVWNADEDTIAKMLKARKFKKEDIYPPKLISPAQVLKSDKLTDQQKKKIEEEYITYKVGSNKLTKVSRENVAQRKTNDVQSPELMFADVVETKPEQKSDEISFF